MGGRSGLPPDSEASPAFPALALSMITGPRIFPDVTASAALPNAIIRVVTPQQSSFEVVTERGLSVHPMCIPFLYIHNLNMRTLTKKEEKSCPVGVKTENLYVD
jgi:hypothetical protein